MQAPRIHNLLRVATVALALAAGGAAVQAQPGPGPDHHGGPGMMMAPGMFGGHMEHVLDLVNATDAQRSQIEAIFKAAHQDLAGQRDSGRQLHEQMAALFTAPNIDAAAIESVRAQMSAQHDAASKRMSQAGIDAARVLTPEQRAKIADVMKKHQARMAGRKAG
ncbi:Spy/CpxP family protein refolding chaperone [Roseateles saccharophilus]|uniref:Spy/CpxP family protein refolding chaperone n=1 Tax=Roseateles saccharophilus TaxID=304 RepID=A0A4R3VEI6_ROSSA|nr:Spy/CpxP family protein refolding chaperone [Roseateles saccharophilus]MDG0832832.1 periplasmic heavy metal sensor [Roseateles saccharophilus]TCV03807.1 Spy/CpxP family protein refolding chaperone [Roseateles saccharophilus]